MRVNVLLTLLMTACTVMTCHIKMNINILNIYLVVMIQFYGRWQMGIHTLRLHLLKCAACIIHLALSKQLAVRTLNCRHRIHSVKCKECSSLGTRNIEEMCAQYHAWSQCSMAACYMLHITQGPGQCLVCSYVTYLHVTQGPG